MDYSEEKRKIYESLKGIRNKYDEFSAGELDEEDYRSVGRLIFRVNRIIVFGRNERKI